MSPDNFFNASDKPLEVEHNGPNESTIPAANTFTVIWSDDEWLKRYLQDGYNSQIENMPNKIEVTTENGEKWYKLKIPIYADFTTQKFTW